jgi:murein DD-endopeptidase MepM/ murein hydrolase activator NlpD
MAALLAVAILLPAVPAYAASSRLEETRRELRATRARLGAVVNDDQAVLAVLTQITARLHTEQSALYAARQRLADIDLQIRAEERRLAQLRARTEARRTLIDERARALYISGPTGLEAMAPGASLDDYLGRAGVLQFVAAFDKQVLEDLARLKDDARKTEDALEVQKERATAERTEISERVEVVAELAATQQEAHDKLSSQASSLRSEIDALEAEQARIQAIIAQRSTTGVVDTGGAGRNGFAWPIRGIITSPYGPRGGGYHTGMDIDCETGDAIGASKAGKVIAAEWGGGYGNMIIIDHGGGYTTLYAHQSSLYVGRGTRVTQHQKIGACGATGNATGDHLHFEIRINGQHTNPYPYMP